MRLPSRRVRTKRAHAPGTSVGALLRADHRGAGVLGGLSGAAGRRRCDDHRCVTLVGPDAVSRWSAWLPTRTWNQVVQNAAFASPELDAWLGLAAWAAVFFGAAWLGYRRDQGRNYR